MATALLSTSLLRSRDLFVHDGATLRRIRLSVPVQLLFVALAAAMLAWSAFAAAHLLGDREPVAPVVVSDMQKMQQLAAAAEQRARAIEQRQALLATMMAGGDVDPAALPTLDGAQALPDAVAAPLDRAAGRVAAEEAAAAAELDARYKKASRELGKLGLDPKRLAVGDPFGRGAAMHAGIDLAGPVGTPIYATADGTVSMAGWHNGGYGNLIRLDHGRGIETRYGHLHNMTVRQGERVKRGQMIGRMGSTGRSTGSHLHYEVRIDGRAVNPVPFMRSNDFILAIRDRSGASMDQVAQGGPARAARGR
jgi:murein DD-endopeptidase MepM/ murein hydrolase activator NlpD